MVAVVVVGRMTQRAQRGWLCRCGYRNDPSHLNCRAEGCRRHRPKRRVPRHARALQELTFEEWAMLSQRVHGGHLYACGLCGRQPAGGRRHDRDHDHQTGDPRGLLCWRCNRELVRHSTLEEARAVVAYLERAAGNLTRRAGRGKNQPVTAEVGEAVHPAKGSGV